MIVKCQSKKDNRWKKFKGVTKVQREMSWSSRIKITGECSCCNHPYTKTLDVSGWSVEREPSEEDC